MPKTNPQFPVALNTNKLQEADVRDMPEWFKTPLDFINKIAETVFYAQEFPVSEILRDLDKRLAHLEGSGGGGGGGTPASEVVTISLADDASINIQEIFDTIRDGEYLVFREADAETFGRFMFNDGTPSNATIIDGSANFVKGDIDNNLCLVQSGNDILLKNRFGSTLDFRVYRRGV